MQALHLVEPMKSGQQCTIRPDQTVAVRSKRLIRSQTRAMMAQVPEMIREVGAAVWAAVVGGATNTKEQRIETSSQLSSIEFC